MKTDIENIKTDILEKQNDRVEYIINNHRKLFDKIVNELITKQVLTKFELETIMQEIDVDTAA